MPTGPPAATAQKLVTPNSKPALSNENAFVILFILDLQLIFIRTLYILLIKDNLSSHHNTF
jgi:hypothetical protein